MQRWMPVLLLALVLAAIQFVIYDQTHPAEGGWHATAALVKIPLDEAHLARLQSEHAQLYMEAPGVDSARAIVWSVQSGGVRVEQWDTVEDTIYRTLLIRWMAGRTEERLPIEVDMRGWRNREGGV